MTESSGANMATSPCPSTMSSETGTDMCGMLHFIQNQTVTLNRFRFLKTPTNERESEEILVDQRVNDAFLDISIM